MQPNYLAGTHCGRKFLVKFLLESESFGQGTRVCIQFIREPEGSRKRDIGLPNETAVGHSLGFCFVNDGVDIQHSDAGECPLAEFGGSIQLSEASL